MSKGYTLESLANMSDEDLMGVDLDSIEDSIAADLDNQESDLDESEGEGDEAETSDEETGADGSDETDASDEDAAEEEEAQEGEEDSDEEEESSDTGADTSDAAKQLEKLLSPFAANGTQIKVDSVDEAIDLMRMGANYHKKMHTLKPHLKLIKTLEKNKLLDENNINFLIDLANKDKKAISKLLADGDINPLDLETEDVNYSPAKHVVSNDEMNLDEVLQSISNTPTFKDTMDIITQQWDASSKVYLTANPQRIADLNAHKANGTFDRVTAEVAKQRMLGKLSPSLSDFEAYETVGMQLMQREALVTANKGTPPKPATKPHVPQNQKALKQKVAAPKKGATNASTLNSIDRLAQLSDEDFAKISKKYI